MMPRRLALIGLITATISIGLAYLLAFFPGGAGKPSAFLMVFGIASMAVSLMTMGAVREGEKLGILGYAFAFVFAVLMIGFGAALLLPDADGPASKLFLGLPPRAALVLYGIGVFPVLVLPLVYAKTFEQRTLTEEDIERVRKAAAAHAEKEQA